MAELAIITAGVMMLIYVVDNFFHLGIFDKILNQLEK
jgi:hypothetical protein